MIPRIHSSCADGILATTTAFMQALPPFPRLLPSDPSRALSTEEGGWLSGRASPAFIAQATSPAFLHSPEGTSPIARRFLAVFFAGTSGAPKKVGGLFKPWHPPGRRPHRPVRRLQR